MGRWEQLWAEAIRGRLLGRQREGERGQSWSPLILSFPHPSSLLPFKTFPFHLPECGHLTLVSASILFPHISSDDLCTDFLQVTKVQNITVVFIPSPFLSFTSMTLLILFHLRGALLTYVPAQARPLLFNQPQMLLLSGLLPDSSAPASDRDALSSSETPQYSTICNWEEVEAQIQSRLVIKWAGAGVKPSGFKGWLGHFREVRRWTFPSVLRSSVS